MSSGTNASFNSTMTSSVASTSRTPSKINNTGNNNESSTNNNDNDHDFAQLYGEEDTNSKILTMNGKGEMVEYTGPTVDEIEDQEPESLDLDLSNGEQKVWLVKLPRRLAERWKDTSKIQGKDLGKVRIKNAKDNDPLKVKLVLNESDETKNLPLEYNIIMNKKIVDNEYVFSEQNLKKFKSERTEVAEIPDQPHLQPLDKKQIQRQMRFRKLREQRFNGKDGGEARKRFIPYVKTIPKKTALVGTVCHECQVVPVMNNKEYLKMLKADLKPKPRQTVTFLNEVPGLIQSNTGPSITRGNISQFLRTDKNKIKGEGRATRMPKKDLLDLLFRLFDEYDYWTMKGLKERTKQPETYLKESLDSVATLVTKGPYALKYCLKPEYKKLRDAERAAKLGELGIDQEEEEQPDEEEVEMEDIA